MKRFAIFVIILLRVITCYGQLSDTEGRKGIVTILSAMKEDTNKVLALMKCGWWWETYNMDSAAACYIKMHKLSQKLDYLNGDLKYYANYTYILNQQGKYAQSLQLNLESLALAKRKGNKEQVAICLFNTGSSYNNMAKYDEAINCYLQAVKVFEELNQNKSLAVAYDNIGGVFSNIGQHQKGLTYHLKAIEKAKLAGDSMEVATALLNTGSQLNKMQQLTEAEKYINLALDMATRVKNTYLQINANLTLAEIFVKQHKADKSIAYALQSLESATIIDSKYSQMEALKILTRCYYLKKDFPATIEYGERSVAFAKKNGITSGLYVTYKILSSAYAGTQNYKAGYDNLVISKNLEDSANAKEITKEIEQLEIDYQTTKKEKQILELEQIKKQQRLLIWSLLTGISVVLMISFLVYKNYRQKRKLMLVDATMQQQKISELETEKQLLATRSVLQGQEEERARLAKDLHDGLGSILSGAKYSFSHVKSNLTISAEQGIAFDRSIALLDTSIKELRRVAHNMMPEALVRFGLDTALKDFCDSIGQGQAPEVTYQSFELNDDTIPQSKTSAIYRIIQELVNNVLKHAHAKTVLVQLIKKEDTLSITIEDDGQGFDTAILKNTSGIGYLNLNKRVAYINGKMDVQSAPGKGTSITIDIPNITHD